METALADRILVRGRAWNGVGIFGNSCFGRRRRHAARPAMGGIQIRDDMKGRYAKDGECPCPMTGSN